MISFAGLFVLVWRPCWLCGSLINPEAPKTSAAFGESVTAQRPGIPEPLVTHAHTACLDIHAAVKARGMRTNLSTIDRAKDPK